MAYQSKNMSYIFFTEYFEGMNLRRQKDDPIVKKKNKDLVQFRFSKGAEEPWEELRTVEGFCECSLYTTYPGLLVGSGIEHKLQKDEVMKLGFCFDHVTGLPFIPGSSVKGMLRACFPGDKKTKEESSEYEEYIRETLKTLKIEKPNMDINLLKTDIFEGNDVFLGAFPVVEGDGTLLEMDYITPHKSPFKGPNAISFLKVKPNVQFRFGFILNDTEESLSAVEKLRLFEQLILDMGIGAKSNVGFGKFSKIKTKNVEDHCPTEQSRSDEQSVNKQRGNYQKSNTREQNGNPPKCQSAGCNRQVRWNPSRECWNKYCQECYQKSRSTSR